MLPLVLIVDDEPGILSTLASVLEDQGYRTLTTGSGVEAIQLYSEHRPEAVLLDIWLPDRDGLETLQALLDLDPAAAVIMMSGHGTTATAVKAIKMGAQDYLEKPLSYAQTAEAVAAALGQRTALEPERAGAVTERHLPPPPSYNLLRPSTIPQRTIRHSTVVYGLGLHSGGRTGMVIQPLPPDSGIHLLTLPTGATFPAHLSAVADTDYATTLGPEGAQVKTVEHLLSALHAAGITNLLIKLHGEVPVFDGSALDFCRTLEQIGIEDQPVARQELVIDRRYQVQGARGKTLMIEPYDGFAVSYHLRYPPPVGEQDHAFEYNGFADYQSQIAPARTFGFMRDLKMMSELGLGSGGRLDNFILVGEDNVLNTELRFANEFARHKVLDIIGDLYLLGYAVRGKVTARLTGHRDNVALLREIVAGS